MRHTLLAAAALLALTGCGSDANTLPDGGVATACAAQYAGCQSLTPATAEDAERTIEFGGTAGNTYAPKCLEVKKGQTVTFAGDFQVHPLKSACGTLQGALPEVVDSNASGSTGTKSITFDRAGDFGYFCTAHGNPAGGGMAGFIKVVE